METAALVMRIAESLAVRLAESITPVSVEHNISDLDPIRVRVAIIPNHMFSFKCNSWVGDYGGYP